MRAGLYMGMPAHAHSALRAPSPTMLKHHAALFSASQITVSSKWLRVSYFSVNEEHSTLLNFPTEESTRQKLRAFLFLVDFIHVDILTFSA